MKLGEIGLGALWYTVFSQANFPQTKNIFLGGGVEIEVGGSTAPTPLANKF